MDRRKRDWNAESHAVYLQLQELTQDLLAEINRLNAEREVLIAQVQTLEAKIHSSGQANKTLKVKTEELDNCSCDCCIKHSKESAEAAKIEANLNNKNDKSSCTILDPVLQKEMDEIKEMDFDSEFIKDEPGQEPGQANRNFQSRSSPGKAEQIVLPKDEPKQPNRNTSPRRESKELLLAHFFGGRSPDTCNENDRNPGDVILVQETFPMESDDVAYGTKHVVPETLLEDFANSQLQFFNERTPQKSTTPCDESRSPVFKDLGLKRLDGSSSLKENVNIMDGETAHISPIRLVDQRLLLKPLPTYRSTVKSPVKRSSSQTEESPSKRTVRTPKRNRKSPMTKKQQTPEKRLSQLKMSNLIQAEVSSTSGVRKFKQTYLNLDSFKKTQESVIEKMNGEEFVDENEGFEQAIKILNEHKVKDDIIFESPTKKSPGKYLTFKKPEELSRNEATTWKSSPDYDVDETLVSLTYLNRMDDPPKTPILVKTLSSPTRLNRAPNQINAVVIKGSPVRKKNERMKLHGLDCACCKRYFDNDSEVHPDNRRKILDKVSRHREKDPIPDTPPGYWKPYMTLTPSQTEREADKS